MSVLTKFKLIPYKFVINKDNEELNTNGNKSNKRNKMENLPFKNFDGNNTDFLHFLYNKLKDDSDCKKEYVIKDLQRSISFCKISNSKRIISGIAEFGEFGIAAPFLDVSTESIVPDITRKPNYSEKYPFFFLFYIPERGSEGTLILQSYRNIGVKTTLEREIFPKYIGELGLRIKMNRLISSDMLDQLNNSRILQFRMIRKQVSRDIADKFNKDNPGDIKEVHSIVAKRKKEVNLTQTIKDIITNKDTKYYEILDQKYDEVKILIEIEDQVRTLTFGSSDKYMESMELKDIQLHGGFPVYADLYDNAIIYLKHIVTETGV
jgi:hypothetical protein